MSLLTLGSGTAAELREAFDAGRRPGSGNRGISSSRAANEIRKTFDAGSRTRSGNKGKSKSASTSALDRILQEQTGKLSKTVISQDLDETLMHVAVHTQHQKHYNRNLDVEPGEQYVKTIKKQVLIPKEDTIKVPVVRKEVVKEVRKAVVRGNKQVPIRKYKEVPETTLEVRYEMVNGIREKRAVPVTKMKKVPYTDFRSEPVEIEVEVPVEEVVTRKGHRVDKHVVSKVYEVEEDHVYEMRPVYVGKAATRMQEKQEHHTFKQHHGKPVWDKRQTEGWAGRPPSPQYKTHLHRPNSAGPIGPAAGKNSRQRPASAGARARTSSHLRAPSASRR